MPADIDIYTFVDRVNAAFREQYCALLLPLLSCSESELFSRLATHPEDRWTCSLVLYSRHHHALWMIGDCQAMVISSYPEYSNFRPIRDSKYLAHSPIRTFVTPKKFTNSLILEERKKVAHSNIRDQEKFFTNSLILEDKETIAYSNIREKELFLILASDGYPRLFPTFSETVSYLTR